MIEEGREIFEQAVFDIVSLIPYGRATSYGVVAKAIGYPNMSRMVGRVISQCGDKRSQCPFHRVVNSQGLLSGRKAFGNGEEMQKMLEKEGIHVIHNKIENWKAVFWNPLEEISL